MPLDRLEHLTGPGPKRILALDGGGVRGLITLGILKRVEDILRERSSNPKDFRLCHYFDLIGGTSTGAIIATLLAIGESVDQVIDCYEQMIPEIFKRRPSLAALVSSEFDGMLAPRFCSDRLRACMTNELNKRLSAGGSAPHELTLGSDVLKTGLAIVTKRIDSGAVWVQTNHPHRKFWHRNSNDWGDFWDERQMPSFYANRDYKLLDLVQASASAPTYFDPVEMQIDPDQTGVFLDGAVSPFNNPALELFFMTTLEAHDDDIYPKRISPHGFGWRQGADELFLLSVGTGSYRDRMKAREFRKLSTAHQAKRAILSMIHDCSLQSIYMLQSMARVIRPTTVNVKLDDMKGLRLVKDPLLTYRRVDAQLDASWLATNLGEEFAFDGTTMHYLRSLDTKSKKNLEHCRAVGERTGEVLVSQDDFLPVFDEGVFPKGI